MRLGRVCISGYTVRLMHGPGRFSIVIASGVFNSVLSSRTSVVSNSVKVLTSTSLSSKGFKLCRPVRNSTPSVTNFNITGPLTAVLSTTVVLGCSLSRDSTTTSVRGTMGTTLRGIHAPSVCGSKFEGMSASNVNSRIVGHLWWGTRCYFNNSIFARSLFGL